MVTRDRLTVQEANEAGMVNYVVPAGELDAATLGRRLAHRNQAQHRLAAGQAVGEPGRHAQGCRPVIQAAMSLQQPPPVEQPAGSRHVS